MAGYALGAMLLLYLVVWAAVLRNLPSADRLLSYQPPLPTMVRGVNGEIVYSYARERRVQLRFPGFSEAADGCLPVGRGQDFLDSRWGRFHRPDRCGDRLW